jgi:acyl-coenzyme A synthetase/AMP-(fatty) acid ligase
MRAPRKPGSVGRPVGAELRVLDDAGRPCAPGTVGRVVILGPGVIRRYDGGGQGLIDGDGWLSTGDLGALDADGDLYLAGRADDAINRGGEKVHPREVEEVLLDDPRVRQAVVVGRPDPVLGATPVAYVVPADSAEAAGRPDAAGRLAADLAARCAERLARHQRPAAVHVVAALPAGVTGPTGKIARRRVAALLASGPHRPAA